MREKQDTSPTIRRRNACIIVLGDIGRSPRMEYHANSFLEEGYNVDIIGYLETKPIDSLLAAGPKCKVHSLTAVPDTNLTPSLKYIFKAFWQTLSLLIALISIRRPNFLLIQNPPAIPTLIVCYLYCALTRTKLVIDWHNFSYTILALSAGGQRSYFVRLTQWLERKFGAKADAHFCVTKSMQKELSCNWKISNAVVLYDRPPPQFHPIDLSQKHEVFLKLLKEYPQFGARNVDDNVLEATAITQKLSDGTIQYQKDRKAVLVSSTSWTPDEDFDILLEALEDYEKAGRDDPQSYPELLCIITGKGPQKDAYIKKISKMKWNKVSIVMPWLEANDYPLVIASADLGVCLHYSSSGRDLPMKVVDMFGCGIPVCALAFRCIDELVVHDSNGYVFECAQELAGQLKSWFKDFPNNSKRAKTKEIFTRNLEDFQSWRWRENWKLHALPVFNSFN